MNRKRIRLISFRIGLFTLGVLIFAVIAAAQEKSLPREMLGGGRLSPTKWSAGCGIDSLYLGLKIIGIEADL